MSTTFPCDMPIALSLTGPDGAREFTRAELGQNS
jgi:hypothetical protein